MRNSSIITALATATLVLAACSTSTDETTGASSDTAPTTAPVLDAPSVVVTTTVLGSVVGEILTCATGDDSSMTVLMPVGADPHDFQASSSQLAEMATADLVVFNGLGLEEGVLDAIENVEADGTVVLEVASQIEPLPFGEEEGHDDDHGEDHGEEEGHDHDHGEFDPHFWFDMERMALAAELIGSALGSQAGDTFESCGKSVAADILTAEQSVAETLLSIPESKRVLVTDHDALAYLADRYDFEVVGTVIPGGSTLADPSSQELATLVAIIEREQVRAIFGNIALNVGLIETLAEEVGDDVEIVELFVGSLGGPGSGAETYTEMMLTNATRIANALAN